MAVDVFGIPSSVVARLPFLFYKLTNSALTILSLGDLQWRVAVFRVIPVFSILLSYIKNIIVYYYVSGDGLSKETRLTVAH